MRLIKFIGSFLLFLTACQTGSVARVVVVPAAVQATPKATATYSPTLPPPQINQVTSVSTQPPPDMPSFAPVAPDALETATPAPQPGNQQPTASPQPPTASPTPQPTFTPPALPQTDSSEHYWLRRPIPEGGTVWTDKTYPYGSTRGGTLETHHGVEFYVPAGTQILAAASGIVRVAGSDSDAIYGLHANFYGSLIVIEHDSPWNGQPIFTLYGHLSEIFVNEGQHVNAQDIIALSGSTGVADGPHLHFEVRQGQNSYAATRNPLLWLWPFPDRGTVAGRITFANGELAYGAPVRAVRVDAPSAYAAATTYADDSVNADTLLNENFALDDIVAGYYDIIVDTGGKKYKETVWVYPRRTSFVEIVIGE